MTGSGDIFDRNILSAESERRKKQTHTQTRPCDTLDGSQSQATNEAICARPQGRVCDMLTPAAQSIEKKVSPPVAFSGGLSPARAIYGSDSKRRDLRGCCSAH